MTSKMGTALNHESDAIVRECIQADYWSKHHKTRNARTSALNEYKAIWATMSSDQKEKAWKAIRYVSGR